MTLAARKRFVDVARFNDVLGAVGIMRPDAGEEIRLKLEPDGELVVFRFTDAAALRLHLAADPEQILHMMADLVRDDVSLGEIARSAKAFVQHPVKSEVDVNAPIFRAIERAARAAGEAAAGPRLFEKRTSFGSS